MSDDKNPKPRKRIDGRAFRKDFFRQQGLELGDEPPDVDEARSTNPEARPSLQPSPQPRPSTGYRNPPPETRFTKGKSGNPRGRPRGTGQKKAAASPNAASSTDAILRGHFGKPMRVREGGETFDIPRLEGFLKLLEQQAAAGSVLAARALIEMSIRTAHQQEAEQEDNEAFWRNYRDTYPEVAERRNKAGDPFPEWMPRPEDVIVEPRKYIRIVGHWDEKSYNDRLLLKRWRDAMHVKMIYDLDVFFSKPDVRTTMTMAEFVVHWFDHLMPTRWKLASTEMRDREELLIWISRPRLIQELQKAFEPLGLKAPIRKPMMLVPDKVLRALKINPKQVRERFAGWG